jgi:hypothetical protein
MSLVLVFVTVARAPQRAAATSSLRRRLWVRLNDIGKPYHVFHRFLRHYVFFIHFNILYHLGPKKMVFVNVARAPQRVAATSSLRRRPWVRLNDIGKPYRVFHRFLRHYVFFIHFNILYHLVPKKLVFVNVARAPQRVAATSSLRRRLWVRLNDIGKPYHVFHRFLSHYVFFIHFNILYHLVPKKIGFRQRCPGTPTGRRYVVVKTTPMGLS